MRIINAPGLFKRKYGISLLYVSLQSSFITELLLIYLAQESIPSKPWLNAKKSFDDISQKVLADSSASRLEVTKSPEDDAVDTLQRKKRGDSVNERNLKSSDVNRELPRPRGRPRKERPFEVSILYLVWTVER